MRRLPYLAFVLVTACQSAPAPGASCTHASDCSASLVCRLGRCRTECAATRDCPAGASCLVDATGAGSCQLDVDRCAVDDDCPRPLVCAGSQCFNECIRDSECPAGSVCSPIGVRLVCRPAASADAAVDAPGLDAPSVDAPSLDAPLQTDVGDDVGLDAFVPPSCDVEANVGLDVGLDGWCLESTGSATTSEIVWRSGAIVGSSGAFAHLAIAAGETGTVTLHQDRVFQSSATLLFRRIALAGAATGVGDFAGVDLLDDTGAVVGRFAAASDAAVCTGLGVTPCIVTPPTAAGVPIPITLAMPAILEQLPVDTRTVVSMRLRYGVVGAGASSDFDGVDSAPPACPGSLWWRTRASAADVVRVELDDLGTTGIATALLRPVGMVLGASGSPCGSGLRLDGSSAVDLDYGEPFGTSGVTIQLWARTSLTGGATLLSARAGTTTVLAITLASGSITASAGTCSAGGAPALSASTAFPSDGAWHEILATLGPSGVRVSIDGGSPAEDTMIGLSCGTSAFPTPDTLRLGAGLVAGTGLVGAVDELWIRRGDFAPSPPPTGDCYVDYACARRGVGWVRDTSGLCFDGTGGACTHVWACPETPASGACMNEGTTDCGLPIAGSCPDGVRVCAPAGGCVPLGDCLTDIGTLCPG